MERLEQARIQAELETQRAIEEERKRLELEMRLALEKEKKETSEQALRIEQLTNSITLIKSILDYSWNLNRKEKDEFEVLILIVSFESIHIIPFVVGAIHELHRLTRSNETIPDDYVLAFMEGELYGSQCRSS